MIRETSAEYLMQTQCPYPIPYSHFTYLKSGIFYLFAGLSLLFVLFITTENTYAESVTVTAKVPAQIPSMPAVITSPVDQQDFDAQVITVNGTCPPEGAYITLLRNSISSGIAPCTSGNFELSLSLIKGANQLQAIVYNSTDDQGPASNIVTVYYTIPYPLPPPVQSFPILPTPSVPIQPVNPSRITPLTLEYHYTYQVRDVGQGWNWSISLQGGLAPYTCSVDWGDGQHEELDPTADLTLVLHHTYKHTGSFTPVVLCRDRVGAEAVIQLLAIVNPPTVNEAVSGAGQNAPQANDAISSYVVLAAPLGAVFVAALLHAFVLQGKLPKLPKLPRR